MGLVVGLTTQSSEAYGGMWSVYGWIWMAGSSFFLLSKGVLTASSASMKILNVAFLSFLHLGVFGNKLRNFNQLSSEASLGNLTVKLKADPRISKDIYEGDCIRPNIRGYHVTELSLFRKQFNVMTACAGMYRGVASVRPCTKHNEPYILTGCDPEMCIDERPHDYCHHYHNLDDHFNNYDLDHHNNNVNNYDYYNHNNVHNNLNHDNHYNFHHNLHYYNDDNDYIDHYNQHDNHNHNNHEYDNHNHNYQYNNQHNYKHHHHDNHNHFHDNHLYQHNHNHFNHHDNHNHNVNNHNYDHHKHFHHYNDHYHDLNDYHNNIYDHYDHHYHKHNHFHHYEHNNYYFDKYNHDNYDHKHNYHDSHHHYHHNLYNNFNHHNKYDHHNHHNHDHHKYNNHNYQYYNYDNHQHQHHNHHHNHHYYKHHHHYNYHNKHHYYFHHYHDLYQHHNHHNHHHNNINHHNYNKYYNNDDNNNDHHKHQHHHNHNHHYFHDNYFHHHHNNYYNYNLYNYHHDYNRRCVHCACKCRWLRHHREPFGVVLFQRASGMRKRVCGPCQSGSLHREGFSIHPFWLRPIHQLRDTSHLFHGTAKVEECDKNGTPYGISGCEPDTCLEPSDATGYVITATSLELHKFSVATECAFGYIGSPKADAHLWDVTATCASYFRGTPKVTQCEEDGLPYAISGCEPDMCVRPSGLEEYTKFVETSLALHNFEVSAECAWGYEGTPVAAPCSGPTTTTTSTTTTVTIPKLVCQAPVDTTGYAITEHNLLQEAFKVEATCTSEYIGNAAVVDCTDDNTEYKLTGCEKKIFCQKPTVSGYDVTETSTVMQDFNHDYQLSGCEMNFCVAPAMPGYAVSELELRQPHFKVTAACATGYEGNAMVEPCDNHYGHWSRQFTRYSEYKLRGCTRVEAFCVAPSVTDGYIVTETDLRIDEFEASAECAPGWTGTAKVAVCTGATPQVSKQYSLSGCTKRTVSLLTQLRNAFR
eukprot:g1045.t1